MTALFAGLGFLGLTLLLGGVLTRRGLTPGTPPLWVAGLGAALLVLGWGGQAALTLGVLGMTAAPDVLAYLTDTGPGRSLLLGLLGAALLLAAELGRWPRGLALACAALTLWGAAGLGHGAGHGAGVRLLHAVHAGAAAVWLGGVLALLLSRPATAAQARRFTPAALGSVAVLAVSGLLMAGEHLSSLAAWTGTPYGRTLLLKLALVGLALLAAAQVRRRFARQVSVRAALAREALLLLAVLGITAALTTQAPPTHAGPGHAAHADGAAFR
ncbi:CopD family protein [Deinococcus petrolearius]|uniref:CopD family protein n=1 Tax=Deinococcus petrolearius TaxID=1751295 RepID=A0ABW1DFC3_9DEIO